MHQQQGQNQASNKSCNAKAKIVPKLSGNDKAKLELQTKQLPQGQN